MGLKSNKALESEILRNNEHYRVASNIIDYWNTFEGTSISRGTDKVIMQILRTLNAVDNDTINLSIANYHTVLNDDSFFFNYRWSIQDFVSERNYAKFIDGGSIWDSYKARLEKPKVEKPIIKYTEVNGYQELLNGYKSMKYDDYLNTEHWKHFINECMKWSGYKCQLCNKDHVMLNVHHKSYDNIGRETFNDVIVLCA